MRIAIFFSGRATDKNVKELLRIKQCYTDIEFFLSVNRKAQSLEQIERVKAELCIPSTHINVEDMIYPEWIYKIKKREESNRENIYSMLYHNYKAFLMIQQHQKGVGYDFDIIMKYRDDIIPRTNKIIDILPKMKNENKLFIPVPYQYYGINDQIAIGNSIIMEKYTSAFKMLKGYTEENSELIFNPEIILKYHTHKVGIEIEKIKFFYKLQKKEK
jgi:hypothetical protein